MDTHTRVQKKPPTASAPKSSLGFQPRGVAAPTRPTQAPRSSRSPAPDLKMQLKRANRFGHHLSAPSMMANQPVGAVQTKAAIPHGYAPLQQQPMEEEEPEQMKLENSAPKSIQRQPAPAAAAPSPGRSMPHPVRSKMERSFGTSFADVSIHTDSPQAQSIGALAYTQGNAVHFAPGQYNPESPSGQALLGHELTHVVQQRAGRVAMPSQSKGAPINADPSLENEADTLGAQAARGEPVQVPNATNVESDTESPVQNSTQPVQCFLPLLMMLLPMLLGGGGGN